ncbi:TPA: hypothetical protein ACGW2D_003259 [Morganella morganii]
MTDKKKIPLYITIAETEEQGAEITTRYIMDKYGVTCSKSQSAIRILDNAGVISAGERRNGIKIVYTVLPGAAEKIAAYGEQVRTKRQLAGLAGRTATSAGTHQDMTERRFVSMHNRLFTALAARRREMKQSSGVVM